LGFRLREISMQIAAQRGNEAESTVVYLWGMIGATRTSASEAALI